MNYQIHAQDIAAPQPLGQGLWTRSQLPKALGDCRSDVCELEPGLSLAYLHYRPTKDVWQPSQIDRTARALTITMALEGESSTVGADRQRFDFIAGHSTVAAFASVRGERRFPAHRAIRQLRLIASEPLLQRYRLAHLLDGVGHDLSAKQLHVGQHSPASIRLAQSLVHLHDRDADVLDLQIASLSLLAEHTRGLAPAPQANIQPVNAALREQDVARLHRARALLLQEFARPLTIAWLCAQVGTNEFKLKQGFRALFDTSPHRMLTEIRMHKAWELLESGWRVSSVAGQVGYQHVSSFSAAFERFYGRTPKSVGTVQKTLA